MLNKESQKEVHDFLDFLLSKQMRKKNTSKSSYKKRILSVSTWSEEDVDEVEKNSKLFNNWKINEW